MDTGHRQFHIEERGVLRAHKVTNITFLGVRRHTEADTPTPNTPVPTTLKLKTMSCTLKKAKR